MLLPPGDGAADRSPAAGVCSPNDMVPGPGSDTKKGKKEWSVLCKCSSNEPALNFSLYSL